MLERSLILVGPYALLSASYIVSMLVFLSLKREIHRLRSRLARLDLTDRLDAMNARLQDAEERTGTPAPMPPTRSLNLSKRSQVIRLSRRGERADTIASTLSLPRREVELLLKVHRVVLSSTVAPTS
jgi:hypothetical protein